MKQNLYIIILLLSFSKATYSSEYIYSPEGCGFKLKFPSMPKLSTLQFGENLGQSTLQAELFLSDSYLRAECYTIKSVNQNMDIIIKDVLMSLAQSDGLNNISTVEGQNKYGTFVKLRGQKKISGEAITYEIVGYHKESSLLTLYAGSRATDYPTDAIYSFLLESIIQ
jgi:hypothetical protein